MAADKKKRRIKDMIPQGYFAQSKDPLNSVVLVLPLFVAYQIGVLGTGGVRNGVDFMTTTLLAGVTLVLSAFMGKVGEGDVLMGYLGFNGIVLVGLLGMAWVLRKRGSLHPRIWPLILLESGIYALLFGSAVNAMIAGFGLGGLAWTDGALAWPALADGAAKGFTPFVALVQSIGAGLYEEIVFRLILLGGLFALLQRFGWTKLLSGVVAVVVSSAIFSGVHHLGSMGDPFTFSVFTYRFFAGVLLSLIYTTRGFAVAVYTHALYDILVMVVFR